MADLSTSCDRCGARVREDPSLLTPRGPIRLHLGPLEICRACAASFLGWLAEPEGDDPGLRSRRNPAPIPTPGYLSAVAGGSPN